MTDRPFTLTGVMRGIRKHGLIDKISEESFTFLVGLILEANEIGFKNPIGLTVNQALAIGGGNSRQTLNSRRTSLAKIKVEGKQLVKIKAGNKGKNSVATYEIDYNLLCSYNGVWQGLEAVPSNKVDTSPHNSLSDHPTSAFHFTPQLPYHPKIREEEIRRDHLSEDDEKFASLIEKFQRADVQFRIANDVQRQMLMEVLEYPESQIAAVLQRAAEKGVKGSNLITWAQKGLENYDRLYNAGAQGLFDSKRDRVERELEEMKRELEEIIQVGNPKNEPWIKQQRERIQHRIELLKVMENPRPDENS